MAERIRIEVAFALPEKQVLVEVELPENSRLADAITAAGLTTAFPDIRFDELQAGIWGRIADRDTTLADGDRVELYRPLEIDPRDARRKRAEAGGTMAASSDKPG